MKKNRACAKSIDLKYLKKKVLVFLSTNFIRIVLPRLTSMQREHTSGCWRIYSCNASKDVIMQHTAPSTVFEAIVIQQQRNIFIDTSFVKTYTIDLVLEHKHSDRLVNFSRYMSSIILFVAELVSLIPNAIGQLKVKSLHQDTINITFIWLHAHSQNFFQRGVLRT